MRVWIVALIAGLTGDPALGEARYVCDFAPLANRHPSVPEWVTIDVAKGATEATVADPITQFWISGPITARIESETDSQISLWWGIATGGHQGVAPGRQSFALRIDKATLQAEIRVRRHPSQTIHDARGRCRLDPGP